MKNDIFNSVDRPFRATPDVRFYYASDSLEAARESVNRALMRSEGPTLVLGGAGLGKSMLSQVVANDLEQRFDTVRLHASSLCSRRALLQSILYELDMPYTNLSEGELRLSLMGRLQPSPDTAPCGVLLIVDEAHTLPVKLLEELRLISNFEALGKPRLSLLLIGSLRLDDTFSSPQLESFSQRIAARCYLQPMSRGQTKEFVKHQLKCAQCSPSEFITSEGLDAVYAASEGIPRLVNQVMDHALMLALVNSQRPISAALIEEAWADLQQLPTPWSSNGLASENNSQSTSIEFGTLEDDEGFGSPSSYVDEDQVQSLETSTAGAPILNAADDCFEFSDLMAVAQAEGNSGELVNDRLQQSGIGALVTRPNEDPLPATLAIPSNPRENIGTTEEWVSSDLLGSLENASNLVIDLEAGELRYRDSAAPMSDEVAQRVPDSAPDLARPFFDNLQTDEDLIALHDEQLQYDMMGVWESDPPLGRTVDLAAKGMVNDERRELEQGLLARSVNMSTIFGTDFDEEIPLTEAPRFQSGKPGEDLENSSETNRSESNKALAVRAADSIARNIESEDRSSTVVSQETLGQEPNEKPCSGRCKETGICCQDEADNEPVVLALSGITKKSIDEAASQEKTSVPDQLDLALEPWSLDVTNIDIGRELEVHAQIEEIVTQLNFSAFSVEPYSVEQIDVAPNNGPAPGMDSIGDDVGSDIYTLPTAETTKNSSSSTGRGIFTDSVEYDDDRDLLIIEEELPNRLAAEALANTDSSSLGTQKMGSYSQLFAKLRK
ncbi:MAG: AAA family ATPase [Planctomycetales bacterium]|nr:AAA family ATPase [Planctomycetales bacterium]